MKLIDAEPVDGEEVISSSDRILQGRHGNHIKGYVTLHGSPIVHRDALNENAIIARAQGAHGREGQPFSKKQLRKIKANKY